MTRATDRRHSGEHIERLLEEIRASASLPVWQRVDELMRAVVDLYGGGLGRIVSIVDAAGPAGHGIAQQMADDELVASLLLVHGLHPDDLATRVQKALIRVRPYLGSHGGDVEVVTVDEQAGGVRLRMTGSCDGCPSSIITVKLAVEGAIREMAPEVISVEVEGVTAEAAPPPAAWTRLDTDPDTRALSAREVDGGRIVLCRLGEELYAYRDGCAACGAPLADGRLDGQLLACPSCERRYDVRLAGRAVGAPDVHLIPIPLLADAAGIQIALGEVRA
jgi:Fe-S cluster biogenesis protein NfuA/nitrite reductase/ring-hydroxylating ferredoxin subunit